MINGELRIKNGGREREENSLKKGRGRKRRNVFKSMAKVVTMYMDVFLHIHFEYIYTLACYSQIRYEIWKMLMIPRAKHS